MKAIIRATLGVLLFAAGAATHAQETPAADGKVALQKAIDFAKAQQTMSFHVKLRSEVVAGGSTNNGELDLEVLLEGSNRGRVRSYTKDDEAVIYTDGTERYVHLVKKEQFVKGSAVSGRDELLAMAGAGPIHTAATWIGQYLTGAQELAGKVQQVEQPAPNTLKLHFPSYDAEITLGAEPQPLPQRLVLDYAKSLGQQNTAVSKMSVTAEFSDWNLAPDIAADAFAWRPPDGMQAYVPEKRATPGGGAGLGAAAPDFTLALYEGGEKVTLSDHKGKDIVLLDFFASWCGPCRMAMPVVHEVAGKYADKGVKLYAVNQREAREKIAKFLEANPFENLSILMDPNGQTSFTYGATSIPRMIIIGKDGTIQAIHAGYAPSLREQLTEELETLVSGKNLVDAGA